MPRRLIFEVCANCGKKIIDDEAAVLIDENNDLLFCNDGCLRENFEEEINKQESEHLSLRSKVDIKPSEFKNFDQYLPLLLNDPDEIWEPEILEQREPTQFVIGEFLHEKEKIYYIASIYPSDGKPAFVYIHFPTRDVNLVQKYRRGQLVYDSFENEVDEEDKVGNLSDDHIAIGLYTELIENHSESDIDIEDYPNYTDLRIPTLDKPQEVWKQIDDEGNTFLVFIAHHPREPEEVAYVVVAIEDELTSDIIPVFSFPTLDQKLLDRFRTGEQIQRDKDEF